MKQLPSKWPSTDFGRSVGFFAQASLELVHEESWESYKVPTLSPMFRLFEAQRIARSVIRGVLPAKALVPIIDEANASFCNDPVIRVILDRKSLAAGDISLARDDKAHDILSQCGFLLKLCRHQYLTVAEHLLIEECFDEARRSEIYLLLKHYYSELLLSGYSRVSIERAVRATFFTAPIKRISKGLLRKFFDQFPNEDAEYNVFGQAQKKLIESIQDLLGIEEVKTRRVPSALMKSISLDKGECVFLMKIQSRDPFSAIYSAGMRLGIGGAVLMLFPGNSLGEMPNHLHAAKKGSNKFVYCRSQPQIQRRVLSWSKHATMRHVSQVAHVIVASNEARDSILGSSFLRATMTASLADQSTAPEVKLLTLWAAFEALLPLVPEGATNRIDHFLEYIVPAVSLSYARDNFIEFSRDAERLYAKKYNAFLAGLPGQSKPPVDKLAEVVVSGDEAQQQALCEIFSDNPLALYRLKSLHDRFGSAIKFNSTIEAHSARVKWQIQRIYRERNTVMHNGESSPFLLQLLSNTYYYYILTYSNIEMVSTSYGGLSIPQSLGAIRKLINSDQAKVTKAKSLSKVKPIEAQALLLDVLSGHFDPSNSV